jgi:putative transposase
MKKRFSGEQIISILREAEAGLLPVSSLCRKQAISDATHLTQEVRRYGGARGKRLKSLEEDNARLRKLLAEALLDKKALQLAFGRKY